MKRIQIRRLEASDSLEDLTALLHRAFGPLGRMGLPCTCVDQSLEVTRSRVERGDCFVALADDRLVGTLTLEGPDRRNECALYRRPDVASVHQFAVEPLAQGLGCGDALLQFAQRWALEQGYSELALDTPSLATHLLAYYERQGFRPVAQLQRVGRRYLSTVLTKTLAHHPTVASLWDSPHRRLGLAAFERDAQRGHSRSPNASIDEHQRHRRLQAKSFSLWRRTAAAS